MKGELSEFGSTRSLNWIVNRLTTVISVQGVRCKWRLAVRASVKLTLAEFSSIDPESVRSALFQKIQNSEIAPPPGKITISFEALRGSLVAIFFPEGVEEAVGEQSGEFSPAELRAMALQFSHVAHRLLLRYRSLPRGSAGIDPLEERILLSSPRLPPEGFEGYLLQTWEEDLKQQGWWYPDSFGIEVEIERRAETWSVTGRIKIR